MTGDPDPMSVATAVGEPLATTVLEGAATVVPLPVPGVEATIAWSVRDETGPHPVWANVGRWPDGTVRVLTADQAAWADLMRAVGARIDEVVVLDYVKAFLDITRGSMVLVRPIATLEEIPWRPGSDDEEANRAALVEDPPDLAPAVQATPSGFHVDLTLVVDQRVQRNAFDVTSDGEIAAASYVTLAERLPLPIAR